MASKIGKILVVDDNLGIRRALEILLPVHFAEVKTLPSPATLVSSLEQFRPDVVLLDMNFNTSINTGNEGLYWAGEIKKLAPDVEVVLFTAYADIALAVEGMKRGAFDFLVKPWENDKLIEVLTAARDKARKDVCHPERSEGTYVLGHLPAHGRHPENPRQDCAHGRHGTHHRRKRDRQGRAGEGDSCP